MRSPGEDLLFERGPPMGVQRWLGLARPDDLHIVRRALLVVLVGWVPLVLLTLAQVGLRGGDGITSLLREVGVHARYLLAAPLLIIAEAQCAKQLSMIVRQFVDLGLVQDKKHGEFAAAVASTRRLLESKMVEIAVFVLAYLFVAFALTQHAHDQLPTWHKSAGIAPAYSAAGWWHILISMPLLLILLLGWFWRLALWARLLLLISGLDLRLVASHPDRAGGLSFVSRSLRAFTIVALAIMTIAAGRSAHFVLAGASFPTPNILFNAGLAIFLLALFAAPLLAFTPTLSRTWQRATIEYGELAGKIGALFERKWLVRAHKIDQASLEKPDFSTTADLYSVASNVYALRFVPVEPKDLIALAVAMLIPFVPVVLLAIPIDVILSHVTKLLF